MPAEGRAGVTPLTYSRVETGIILLTHSPAGPTFPSWGSPKTKPNQPEKKKHKKTHTTSHWLKCSISSVLRGHLPSHQGTSPLLETRAKSAVGLISSFQGLFSQAVQQHKLSLPQISPWETRKPHFPPCSLTCTHKQTLALALQKYRPVRTTTGG